jgi:N-acetylneuraminic acid mutarotase
LDAWRPRVALPNPRNHLAAIALNGVAYAIGGQHLGDEARGNQASVHAYDASTDQWHAVAGMPAPRSHVSASVFEWNGRIVVAGGLGQGATQLADVIAYDPATNVWSSLPALPAPRQSPVAGDVEGHVIVATGGHNGPRDSTWELRQ